MSLGDLLRWSGGELPLSQFESRFGGSAPAVIKIICGFDIGDGEFFLSTGEMFLVHGIARQSRIVVQGTTMKLYSFPASCQLKFHLVDVTGKPGEAVSLQEAHATAAADRKQYGATPSVVLQNTDRALFVVGDGTGSSLRFGKLKLVDSYEEVYLIAHVISSEGISREQILLPTYVKTCVVDFAVGLKADMYSDGKPYEIWLREQVAKVRSTHGAPARPSDDIFLVRDARPPATDEEDSAVAVDSHYERLKPIRRVDECVPDDADQYEKLPSSVDRQTSTVAAARVDKTLWPHLWGTSSEAFGAAKKAATSETTGNSLCVDDPPPLPPKIPAQRRRRMSESGDGGGHTSTPNRPTNIYFTPSVLRRVPPPLPPKIFTPPVHRGAPPPPLPPRPPPPPREIVPDQSREDVGGKQERSTAEWKNTAGCNRNTKDEDEPGYAIKKLAIEAMLQRRFTSANKYSQDPTSKFIPFNFK